MSQKWKLLEFWRVPTIQEEVPYLQQDSQQPAQHLVLAEAQEAVCVEPVVLAIQTQGHAVLLVLHRVPGQEGDLGGGPPEIQSPHCPPAGAQPVAHKAILGGGGRACA